MPGFRIDLGKLVSRVPVPKAVGKAAGLVNDALTTAEGAADSAGSPVVAAKLRHCTISCPAEITGIADLPRLGTHGGTGIDVALLRLRVQRPDGAAECCVRQYVPRELRAVMAPGAPVTALAHDTDPGIAVVDWEATGKRWQARLSWVVEKHQYAWPDREDWPAQGAIEVRDKGRHAKRLGERRTAWSAQTARLRTAGTGGGRTDDREDWDFDLELGDGRRIHTKERAPDLALARLVSIEESEKARFGGVLTTRRIVAREGAPIAVLLGPKGEVAIDWEATLRL